MKTTDPTLQAAAEAFYDVQFPEYTDEAGETFEPGRPADFLTATELEQLLAVVRAAIAAPVLALHQPCHEGGRRHKNCACVICVCIWPCPTVRALGVTG